MVQMTFETAIKVQEDLVKENDKIKYLLKIHDKNNLYVFTWGNEIH